MEAVWYAFVAHLVVGRQAHALVVRALPEDARAPVMLAMALSAAVWRSCAPHEAVRWVCDALLLASALFLGTASLDAEAALVVIIAWMLIILLPMRHVVKLS